MSTNVGGGHFINSDIDCDVCGKTIAQDIAVAVDRLEVDPRAATDDGLCLVCPACAAELREKGDG